MLEPGAEARNADWRISEHAAVTIRTHDATATRARLHRLSRSFSRPIHFSTLVRAVRIAGAPPVSAKAESARRGAG